MDHRNTLSRASDIFGEQRAGRLVGTKGKDPISREKATEILTRLLSRIDKGGTYDVEWHDFMLYERKRTRFSVVAAHVFGSYARGATQCGDIDLILDIELHEGWLPPVSTIRRAVFGRVHGADVLAQAVAHPYETQRFAESVRVWSTDARDWRKAVESIRADPDVARFERKSDKLPVDLRRVALRSDQAEEIVDLIAGEQLISDWLTQGDLPANSQKWTPSQDKLKNWLTEDAGKRTRLLLPEVLAYVVGAQPQLEPTRYMYEPTDMRLGCMRALLGRPRVPVEWLDNVGAVELLLVPHTKKNEPFGMWRLRRGAQHPAIHAFDELKAWVELDKGGPRYFIAHDNDTPTWSDGVRTLALARTRKGAQQLGAGSRAKFAELRGEGIEKAIAHAQQVRVGEHILDVRGDALEFAGVLRTALADSA